MNCEALDRHLDAWLDGELAATEARALESHLAACADCSRQAEALRRLREQARALPSRLEPARDLWPQIAARLEPRRAGPAPWMRALAASLAVAGVFVAGMLASRVFDGADAPATEQFVETAERPALALPSAAEARRLLPASHVELIEGTSGGERNGLAAATEQNLLQNLLLVNLAIRKVEMAVEQDPSNSGLHELLADLYLRENRILAQAERLRVVQQTPTRTGI